jgi:hypothetical protein
MKGRPRASDAPPGSCDLVLNAGEAGIKSITRSSRQLGIRQGEEYYGKRGCPKQERKDPSRHFRENTPEKKERGSKEGIIFA